MFSMWIRSKVRNNCTEKVKKWGSADSCYRLDGPNGLYAEKI